jgi:hypothetical protein
MNNRNYKRSRNYLTRRGFTMHQAHKIIKRYGRQLKIELAFGDQKYFDIVGDAIQEDFQKFRLFFNSVKADYPQKKKPVRSNFSKSYDEWWQEKNLDGSFAYNGVTDDF